MQTTQHTRCPVLLHPACTTNPDAVRAVQQATGRLVVLNGGKPQLSNPTFHFVTGEVDPFPASVQGRRFLVADDFTGPFGGDAA
ncbi:hypothetical protein [Aquipseudomonas alcaligenes]|uniref:Uncharacterized protein n=1 Tax=Aquipseudomonas alcaligenes (strain ATCC 14909 / DSM 50342 / CCUG 1425 / JCM 20561 / NBRC 14159 / NCIMB 9945 / NCTC 10367 / 1577) TaxID=1215092 RepID=U2ZNN7_AQUA1|nr:hypothetical protein [Pseudomonas alcaligenes]GAD62672.1 hypothetical protein PA6_014_00450 [Pseudomonas alcaligenes NBRC 14159]SUD18240.1 Uncharacterised protein [Pseudomonas alcaligenes]